MGAVTHKMDNSGGPVMKSVCGKVTAGDSYTPDADLVTCEKCSWLLNPSTKRMVIHFTKDGETGVCGVNPCGGLEYHELVGPNLTRSELAVNCVRCLEEMGTPKRGEGGVLLPKKESQELAQHFFGNSLGDVATQDVKSLVAARKHYGESWCKRGGVSAYMMLARKWDRLEMAAEEVGWDLELLIKSDVRAEGVLDDIRDLRRYLLLVEEKWGKLVPEVKKD